MDRVPLEQVGAGGVALFVWKFNHHLQAVDHKLKNHKNFSSHPP